MLSFRSPAGVSLAVLDYTEVMEIFSFRFRDDGSSEEFLLLQIFLLPIFFHFLSFSVPFSILVSS